MKDALLGLQILISSLLILFILVQVKGTGFGRVWGDTTSFTRRGLERLVFRLTIVLSVLFIIVSALQFVV